MNEQTLHKFLSGLPSISYQNATTFHPKLFLNSFPYLDMMNHSYFSTLI
jgi:hypothetical protein